MKKRNGKNTNDHDDHDDGMPSTHRRHRQWHHGSSRRTSNGRVVVHTNRWLNAFSIWFMRNGRSVFGELWPVIRPRSCHFASSRCTWWHAIDEFQKKKNPRIELQLDSKQILQMTQALARNGSSQQIASSLACQLWLITHEMPTVFKKNRKNRKIWQHLATASVLFVTLQSRCLVVRSCARLAIAVRLLVLNVTGFF